MPVMNDDDEPTVWSYKESGINAYGWVDEYFTDSDVWKRRELTKAEGFEFVKNMQFGVRLQDEREIVLAEGPGMVMEMDFTDKNTGARIHIVLEVAQPEE